MQGPQRRDGRVPAGPPICRTFPTDFSYRCARAVSDSSRRTAEPRDEITSLHSITSSAMASNIGGTSMPITLAACKLIANSNLVECMISGSAGFSSLRMRPE
jgi:hypothetical protein